MAIRNEGRSRGGTPFHIEWADPSQRERDVRRDPQLTRRGWLAATVATTFGLLGRFTFRRKTQPIIWIGHR